MTRGDNECHGKRSIFQWVQTVHLNLKFRCLDGRLSGEPYESKGSRTVLRAVGLGNRPADPY
jgi:hypothetical protein